MSDSFFKKLHNVTSGIQKDVCFLTDSLAQPKSTISSHTAAMKMRNVEDDLKSASIDYENSYHELKHKVEACSKYLQEKKETFAEMEQNLNRVELLLGKKHATYKPSCETSCKEVTQEIECAPKFLAPLNPFYNNRLCPFTPICPATPRTQITTSPTYTVASSTPITYGQSNISTQNYTPYSGDCRDLITPNEKTTIFNWGTGTPEEPVLHNKRFIQNHGRNCAPELTTRYTINFANGSESNTMNFLETKNTTPEEPLLRSCKKIPKDQKYNGPSTPEEPVLMSKVFLDMDRENYTTSLRVPSLQMTNALQLSPNGQ